MGLRDLRMPRLARSLCGLSLENGCMLIGWLHVVGIGILLCLAFLSSLTRSIKRYQEPDWQIVNFNSVFSRSVGIITCIMQVSAVSGALLYGVKTKESKWLEPYLLTKGTLMFLLFLDLVTLISVRYSGFRDITAFLSLTFYALEFYMFAVVYNYYQDLKGRYPPQTST